jgi:hypothetical protein
MLDEQRIKGYLELYTEFKGVVDAHPDDTAWLDEPETEALLDRLDDAWWSMSIGEIDEVERRIGEMWPEARA